MQCRWHSSTQSVLFCIKNDCSRRYLFSNHNDAENEYNPYLKATLLEVVDNQLNDNDPPETRETLERLIADEYTEEKAKERIASLILMHVYDAMHDLKEFDGEKYKRDLAELK